MREDCLAMSRADDPLLGRADIEAHEPTMKVFYIAHNSLNPLGGVVVGENPQYTR